MLRHKRIVDVSTWVYIAMYAVLSVIQILVTLLLIKYISYDFITFLMVIYSCFYVPCQVLMIVINVYFYNMGINFVRILEPKNKRLKEGVIAFVCIYLNITLIFGLTRWSISALLERKAI